MSDGNQDRLDDSNLLRLVGEVALAIMLGTGILVMLGIIFLAPR